MKKILCKNIIDNNKYSFTHTWGLAWGGGGAGGLGGTGGAGGGWGDLGQVGKVSPFSRAAPFFLLFSMGLGDPKGGT